MFWIKPSSQGLISGQVWAGEIFGTNRRECLPTSPSDSAKNNKRNILTVMVEPFSRSIRSQKGKPRVSETPVKDNRDLRKQLPPSSTASPSLTNRPVEPTPSGVGEPIYGDTAQDAGDEVRFSIELTQIDRLKDTYSLDICRLKGNLRSYKFLYDTIRERADLQSEVQEPLSLGRYALPSRVLGGHGHARNYLHILPIFCSLSSFTIFFTISRSILGLQ
ncbi:hypothetical protein EV363DRAFT_1406436 [Boletus edulis]|nr:hypothetical protein EV363DRAFT_1406436 [Boletus edulis]